MATDPRSAGQSITYPEELKKLPAPLFSAKKRMYEAPERQAEGKAMGKRDFSDIFEKLPPLGSVNKATIRNPPTL